MSKFLHSVNIELGTMADLYRSLEPQKYKESLIIMIPKPFSTNQKKKLRLQFDEVKENGA